MKKILILTTADRDPEYTESLKLSLEEDIEESHVDIFCLNDLEFYFKDEMNIYHKGEKLTDYAVVYIKHWHAQEESARVVSDYFSGLSIPVIPSETGRIVPKTKFAETFVMGMNNLPIPGSIYFEDNQKFVDMSDELFNRLGAPIVFKAIDGKKGANNYLVNTVDEIEKILNDEGDHHYIAQQFIENAGDYRIINFGDELKIAIYRTRAADTHLNNTSQGGDGLMVPMDQLPKQVRLDSIAAAKLLGRELSGIDVVIDPDGSHYFFEINYSPQVTTGTYLDIKRAELRDYIQKLIES